MSGIIEMVLRDLGVDEDKIKEIRDTEITDKIYYDSVSPDSQSSAFGGAGLKYYDIMIKFYEKIEDILSNNHTEFFKKMGRTPAAGIEAAKTPKKKGGGKRRRKSKKRKSKRKQSKKSRKRSKRSKRR